MKKLFLLGAMVCALGMFAACGDKDNSNLIIGNWANTAQSYDITIAGQVDIPEGAISMEFTDSKVLVSDQRANCLPEWHGYTLSKESGKQLLEIEGGCHAGIFVVEELTNDKLVMAPEHHEIDMDFRYIMKRR